MKTFVLSLHCLAHLKKTINIMEKRLFTIIVSAVATLAAAAQDGSLPLVEEGRTWNIVGLHPGATIEDCDYTDLYGRPCVGKPHQYVIEGDSVIEGTAYKRLRCGGKTTTYMRQEGPRVYVYYSGESLAYDFSLNERDTIDTFGGRLVADKVDTVKVNGVCRRRLTMNCISEFGDDGGEWLADIWVEGIGGAVSSPSLFPMWATTGNSARMESCLQDGNLLFSWDDFKASGITADDAGKCATPAIAYDNGRLLFSCATEGAECVYEIKCADAGGGRGNEAVLGRTYEISVRATLDGWHDSDVAVATIGWRNGRPVMEGFSSVTMDAGDGSADVNGDGAVDVADIAGVIAVMAEKASE